MAILMDTTPSKQVFDDHLEQGEKKNVTQSKIRWIGRLFQYGDVLLSREQSDVQGTVSRCIVVVKQPQFVLPQKKMQWMQKAKLILIYSQEFMLDDYTICISFFRSELTQYIQYSYFSDRPHMLFFFTLQGPL